MISRCLGVRIPNDAGRAVALSFGKVEGLGPKAAAQNLAVHQKTGRSIFFTYFAYRSLSLLIADSRLMAGRLVICT